MMGFLIPFIQSNAYGYDSSEFQLSTSTSLRTMSLGEVEEDSIDLTWNTKENLQINEVYYDETKLDGIKIAFQEMPLILKGSESGISSGRILYTVTIPNNYCNDEKSISCISKSEYKSIIELNYVYDNRIYLQGLELVIPVIPFQSEILVLIMILGLIIVGSIVGNKMKNKNNHLTKKNTR